MKSLLLSLTLLGALLAFVSTTLGFDRKRKRTIHPSWFYRVFSPKSPFAHLVAVEGGLNAADTRSFTEMALGNRGGVTGTFQDLMVRNAFRTEEGAQAYADAAAINEGLGGYVTKGRTRRLVAATLVLWGSCWQRREQP
jgi:hypothetical protein